MLGLGDLPSPGPRAIDPRGPHVSRTGSLPPTAHGILTDATTATDTPDTGGRTVGYLRRIMRPPLVGW